MAHKFFISHFSGDKHIAELFANTLRRITLEQIDPWFSSDSTGDSGLKPGDIWFNQLLTKITKSRAVVALLTPNSINRPWVYFESGIGQALKKCEVIPICIGVKRDSILPPLGLYQCYQLNDYRSIIEFFTKLLSLFEIRFDEEMSRVILEKLVSEISKVSFEIPDKHEEPVKNIEIILENFKSHIDKRFIELLEKPLFQTSGSDKKIKVTEFIKGKSKLESLETKYSVTFSVDFPKLKNKELFVDIWLSDSFQTLTNNLYFMLRDYIGAYKYLEEWVIIDPITNKHIIIREVADRIPASSIFKPNSKWKIIKLKKPYSALDSKARILKLPPTRTI
jgi:hypothetical protein